MAAPPPRVNRHVLLLVASACVLVAGLWLMTLFTLGSTAWLFGALVAVHGFAGLCYGGWRLRQR